MTNGASRSRSRKPAPRTRPLGNASQTRTSLRSGGAYGGGVDRDARSDDARDVGSLPSSDEVLDTFEEYVAILVEWDAAEQRPRTEQG